MNDLQVINQSEEVAEVFQDNVSPDRLISDSPLPAAVIDLDEPSVGPPINIGRA